MKIAIIGASGFVGKALTAEALNRGHEVTAIARNPEKIDVDHPSLHKAGLDILDVAKAADTFAGHEVVLSAFNPGWSNPNIYDDFLAGAKSIQQATKQSGVKRLIVIGGGGSLYVAEGLQAVDTEHFPAEFKSGALAARDYLNIIKEEKDLDWVFFSPAFEMHPGITDGRTGNYRLGKDQPVFDDNQRSRLSVEDLAVVILDEIEKQNHHQERFTAAY